jgi:DNA-binding transcriptional LysR family regulator
MTGGTVELRQLEHFLAVADEGSFTAAAARLHMVQSSLSASVRALEREVGAPLFVRIHRGVRLTDAGEALRVEAAAILRGVEHARDVVAQTTGLLRGRVRVATVALPRQLDLVEVVCAFRRDHPGVAVHLLHDGARNLVQLVLDGEVDLAVTPLAGPEQNLSFVSLLSTPVVAICRVDHPLAGRRQVPLAELAEQDTVDLPNGWWVRHLVDEMFAGAGLPRSVRMEVDEWFGLLAMVQRGFAIGFGPEACLDREVQPTLTTVGIAGAPEWEVGIATLAGQPVTAAARALLAEYRAHCAARGVLAQPPG